MRTLAIVSTTALVIAGVVAGEVLGHSATAVATTTSRTATTAYERPQAGWTVATASARGVMVDYKMINVAGVYFRTIRLHARTTLLRWHVGAQDPPSHYGQIPPDAGPSINWPNEGLAGVVAVFNGAFKVGAKAGGSMVDGVTLSPMLPGEMTLAINAAGHWKMGVWAAGFPGPAFHAIAYRQNLMPMVANGQLTSAARSSNEYIWGDPLKPGPQEPRTALGIDVHGNLVYVATMSKVSPTLIAQALLGAGAFEGMELDINPYWPILGAPFAPLHSPGIYPVQIPYAEHNPTIYNTGWERDFFVGLAEPSGGNCSWTSQGLARITGRAQPQPLREVCSSKTASSSTPFVAR